MFDESLVSLTIFKPSGIDNKDRMGASRLGRDGASDIRLKQRSERELRIESMLDEGDIFGVITDGQRRNCQVLPVSSSASKDK